MSGLGVLGDPGIKLCVCAPSLGVGETGEGGGALEPAGGIGWLWGPPDRDVAPCLSPWWDLCLLHWWGVAGERGMAQARGSCPHRIRAPSKAPLHLPDGGSAPYSSIQGLQSLLREGPCRASHKTFYLITPPPQAVA